MLLANLQQVFYVTEPVQAVKVPVVVGSILVVGVLIRYTLPHSLYDLKVALLSNSRVYALGVRTGL